MEPFKNKLSPQLVTCIAGHLELHLEGFDRANFEATIIDVLDTLELKERSQFIAEQLHGALPKQAEARNRILLAMLHPVDNSNGDAPDDGQSNDLGIRGWGMMPLCTVVGQYGLDDFEQSLALLKEMTSRFSSEFDVRYFLVADQSRALSIMASWLNDANHHVRRLVSEGSRPRLPWGMQLPQLIIDPSPTLPLLEALRDDSEEYVRRSVANHLNDIAKDHPDLIANLAKQWMRGADKNRKRLLRHACRTLIKQGHPVALEVFGFAKPQIEFQALKVETPTVEMGESLQFAVQIKSVSDAPQQLLIDYLIHFKKSNGKLAAKVFKWKTIILKPQTELTLLRTHAIRPVTTRKYYAGQQGLSLRINGEDYGYEVFDLNC